MIYLWTDGQGWTEHELTETKELKKRHITVGNGAHVGNGATPTIIYIIGSRGNVSAVFYWGEPRIDIGCENHSIDDWLKTGLDIAAKHGFSESEVAEYRRYIEMIAAIHAANPDTAKSKPVEAINGGES